MREHAAEVAAIAVAPDAPTFDNTVAALDAAAATLGRIERLFHNLASSETSPALQAVEREMAPRLAAHHNGIHLDAALFARIDQVHRDRATRSGSMPRRSPWSSASTSISCSPARGSRRRRRRASPKSSSGSRG